MQLLDWIFLNKYNIQTLGKRTEYLPDSNDNASAVDTSVKEGPSLLNIALYHPVNIGSVQSLFLPPLPVTAVLRKPKALRLAMLILNLR